MSMFEQLSAPFPPDAIHWRAQNVSDRNGGTALALAYIDARDVMDRLDAVCGPENWSDTYEETAKGRIIGTLAIRGPGGQWISKSDGAGDTDVEGEKGALSDALKRTAVKWGIGRYLYDLGNVWAPCELIMRDGKPLLNNKNKPQWKAWKPEARDLFAKALGSVSKPTGRITDATRDWLGAQLQSVGKGPHDLLKHLSPKDLRDVTYEQLGEARQFINANKKVA